MMQICSFSKLFLIVLLFESTKFGNLKKFFQIFGNFSDLDLAAAKSPDFHLSSSVL